MITVSRARGDIILDEPYTGPGQLKIDGRGYAQISIHNGYVNGVRKYKTILLHRYIMNAPAGVTVDHINGNKLDNRKMNLRLCSQSENNMNRGVFSNNKSGIKGVSWNKSKKKWVAQIQVNGKRIYLGAFDDKLVASNRYIDKSKELFGRYCNEATIKKEGRVVNA